jgi:hypothetical protein
VTDRQFSECCYGNDWQHTAAQDCPLELHFDRWTNSYRDRFNDVFVVQRAGKWEVSSRGRGNSTLDHGSRADLTVALDLASTVICDRLTEQSPTHTFPIAADPLAGDVA